MKTRVFLVRHGESKANERSVFGGHTDLDLTERGHLQAQKAADYLKDIPIDVIYASDLLRAYHTAEYTAKQKGMQIIKNINLREIYGGEWEDVAYSTLEQKYKKEYGIWLHNIGCACCTEGESVEQLQERIVAEVEKIIRKNEGKSILIFTHATPIRVLVAAWCNKTKEEIKDVPWASNASVTMAEYEDGLVQKIEYTDAFLEGLVTALSC